MIFGISMLGGGFIFFKIFIFYLGTVNSTLLLVKFLVTSTNRHRPKKSIYLVKVHILPVKFYSNCELIIIHQKSQLKTSLN